MRKVSIIALVVILAGALSVVGFAVSDKATANANFNVNSAISLTIKDGVTVGFGDVTPGKTYEEDYGTKLKVKANSGLDWNITKSKSSDSGYKATNALTAVLGTTSGTGNSGNIKVDYTLDVPITMPTGSHTVTVEFTVST